MRDLRRVEKDAVILKNIETIFFPNYKQTIITTQRLKGRIICQSDSLHYNFDLERGDRLQKVSSGKFLTRAKERKVKFLKKGGEN